jgi:DNA invertase Pin-like site-specific DNA recombinase
MAKLGYARVSSNTQDYHAQVEALQAAGCKRIYSEKASGKSTNGRPELAKLMKALATGDTVLVCKLDRIARSSKDLHNILGELKDKGCGFASLGDGWCDTTNEAGRLVITIMGGIAEFERELINSRTAEGRNRVIQAGKKMGPRFMLSPFQQAEAIRRVNAGESMVDIGRSYNVSHATISRLAAKATAAL